MSADPNAAVLPAASATTPPAWPRTAFVGAGRIARVLAPALARLGVPVVAIASRQRDAAGSLADAVAAASGGPRPAVGEAQAAADAADWVWLTVVDDAIAPSCAALRWRPGQVALHCSGATELDALAAARAAGAQVAGFHPLQIFSDPALAARRLAGSSVAIEAEGAAREALEALAAGLGLAVLNLPPGRRAIYHAGAAYAASYLIALLGEATAVWRELGFDEAQALRALLPLAHLSLDAAAERGLAGAQAGPIARGDAAVVRRQLAALAALGEAGPAHAAFYREMGRRQWALAQRAGRLDADALARLREALDEAPGEDPS